MRTAALIITIVLLGLLAAALVAGAMDSRRAKPLPPDSASAPAPGAADTNDVAETESIPPQDQTVAPTSAAPDTTDQAAATSNDAQTMISQLPTMLTGDIQKALRKNETRLWHMNGMRGYVVLSDDSAAASACKNVVVTLITGQEQRQTSPQKWCRSQPEGEWAPS